MTDWPREHSHYITETIGSERYDELRAQAEGVGKKVNWDDKYEELKKIARELDIKI
jgi:predicted enzyme involved in methoxymalonyl-ACP biosynthesis